MVENSGIEPLTSLGRLSVLVSLTHRHRRAELKLTSSCQFLNAPPVQSTEVVENSGIEPLTSCVQSRRSPS
jgi:hypothetical protein